MLARAFWGSPSVIVAVDMNICKLIIRPADEEIKSREEERKKHKIQFRKTNRSGRKKKGLGMGLVRCLSQFTLALN